MATATKSTTAKSDAPIETTVLTVAEISAMTKTARRKAITEERAAVKNAPEGTTIPTPVTDWVNDPANAEKREAQSKKATTRRGNFAVIPYPNGKSEYDLETQTHKCEGVCGRVLPIRKFPTTTPDKRTGECRECRNARQDREGKAKAGTAYVAKAADEAKPKTAPKAAQEPATGEDKAPKAPRSRKPSSPAPEAPKVSTRRSRAKATKAAA